MLLLHRRCTAAPCGEKRASATTRFIDATFRLTRGPSLVRVHIRYRNVERVSYHARMTALARTRKQLGTWLALLAMCLIVFAPLVSQMRASARAASPDAALCSAGPPIHSHAAVANDPLAACGYCNLLATPSAPPPLAPSVAQWLPLFAAVVIMPALRADFPTLPYFAGYPRAPPSAH
ncbi:DUF2946 domain-containing protein [Paraburkholderia tropica]|uniref:DUF2946 domain-containing protein n=1 Tax=Paraburkholderia tropica TaxID=92647 RepID=UPI002AB6BF82|nr:DUF2946 domain-containing protein [Paraburkholderia tropica]